MYINQLAWANTTIFDYEGLLKTGSFTLYMWTYAEDVQNEEIMNPLGILKNVSTFSCNQIIKI